MRYTSEPGAKVVLEQPRRPPAWRFVCKTCGADFYQPPKLAAARELFEACLFHECELPWDTIAFATTRATPRLRLIARKEGSFALFFAETVPAYA